MSWLAKLKINQGCSFENMQANQIKNERFKKILASHVRFKELGQTLFTFLNMIFISTFLQYNRFVLIVLTTKTFLRQIIFVCGQSNKSFCIYFELTFLLFDDNFLNLLQDGTTTCLRFGPFVANYQSLISLFDRHELGPVVKVFVVLLLLHFWGRKALFTFLHFQERGLSRNLRRRSSSVFLFLFVFSFYLHVL